MTSLDDDLLELSIQRAASAPADPTSLRDVLWQRLRETGWTWAPHKDRAYGSRPHATDVELLRAYLRRDPDAFEALVERHGGALLAYARKQNPTEAEDCVQDAFLVLFRKAAQLVEDPAFKLRQFLFGVTRIQILDRQRKRVRADKAIEALARELPPDDPCALGQLLEQERQQLIEHLSERCRPLEQDVILLVMRGHSNDEIAQQLDLNSGHVRVLKHRALTTLKAAIASGANDDDS